MAAHPGIGIVQDSKGNVFYTDLVHVWKITPEGKKTIAVKNVHTHELRIDNQDNLYGENSTYEGEKTNRWHYRIWKRDAAGKITDLFGKQPGFREDRGFVQDRNGTQYFIRFGKETAEICSRTPDGKITVLKPDKPINRVSWLALAPNQKALYLSSNSELYKMQLDGKTETLLHKNESQRQMIMGIWPAANGDVYVADFGEQVIKRIKPDGSVSVAAQTTGPWAPSGILVSADKALWVLEYSTLNEARARKIEANGRITVY